MDEQTTTDDVFGRIGRAMYDAWLDGVKLDRDDYASNLELLVSLGRLSREDMDWVLRLSSNEIEHLTSPEG